MKFILLTLFTYLSFSSEYHYPYPDNPDKNVYKTRREKLASKLKDYQAFTAFSSDFYTSTNYQTFRQSSNLLYLTGFPDKEAILLIDPAGIDIDGEIVSEVLFMRFQEEDDKIWHGINIKPEYVRENLGIEKVADIDDFTDFMRSFSNQKSELLVATYTKGKHFAPYLGSKNQARELEIPIIQDLKNDNPYLLIQLETKYLKKMRAIKDSSEISLIQKAIDISSVGHINAIKNMNSGDYEFEIEALMEGKFLELGAENNGYNSIIGAGENTCYLHYTRNRQKAKNGDLVLMDCGAEYHGYTADITRTVPINGKFTKEQKIIYNVVLKAQNDAINFAKAGIPFSSIDTLAKQIIRRELVDLGILEENDDVKKYFPHGTSHYLGLDVHDVGPYDILRAGNVITIEPGIYIPAGSDCDPKWWNIGVRIEDDVLILEDSCVNLSKNLPKKIEDIEKLMERK